MSGEEQRREGVSAGSPDVAQAEETPQGIGARISHLLFGGTKTRRWVIAALGKRGAVRVILLCLVQSLAAVNGVAFALVMRQAIDVAVAGDGTAFGWTCALFAGLLILQVGFGMANRAMNERAKSAFENCLRLRVFDRVLAQSMQQASVRHSGDLMTHLTSDVTVVAEGATTLVPTAVSMGVRLVGVFAALFVLVPQLAVAFLILGCIGGAASILARPLLKRLHSGMQAAEGAMRSFMQECLESLLVVHAFGVERKVARQADGAMREHRRRRLRKADASNACNTALSLAVQMGYVLGFAWCGFGIVQGTTTYGTLMAVVQLIGQVQAPFTTLGGQFSRYSSLLASAERLMDVEKGVDIAGQGANTSGAAEAASAADAPSADAAPAKPAENSELIGANAQFLGAHLHNVEFGYDRGLVLHDCTLDVVAGEFVGIVGPSGMGKSTIVKLLLGAYAPTSGEVYFEAAPLAPAVPTAPASADAAIEPAVHAKSAAPVRIPAATARGFCAFVPQGNCLMAGTVREVVAFAEQSETPDDARVREALHAACALEFVNELPEGLDTLLGERGAGLSEGQMQRLAVARAVYSGAPLLLLDEATSALDGTTERTMLARLRELPGRAAIVVTHRPEALSICDRVIRVEEGRISPA